jgi:hypothetical protein
LVFGLYRKRANTQGALFAIALALCRSCCWKYSTRMAAVAAADVLLADESGGDAGGVFYKLEAWRLNVEIFYSLALKLFKRTAPAHDVSI